MRDRDATAAKLEAFLEVLDDLIGETLAAGVSEAGLRRTLLACAVTLLACAVTLFKSPDALPDGIAALDHFRRALERELVPLYGRGGG